MRHLRLEAGPAESVAQQDLRRLVTGEPRQGLVKRQEFKGQEASLTPLRGRVLSGPVPRISR